MNKFEKCLMFIGIKFDPRKVKLVHKDKISVRYPPSPIGKLLYVDFKYKDNE
jgi:hypothetical protein